MTQKKRGPPPKPPTSVMQTVKGMAISAAARKIMGHQPQAFPLSYAPVFRNNVFKLNYPNPIRTHTIRLLKNRVKRNNLWWNNNL